MSHKVDLIGNIKAGILGLVLSVGWLRPEEILNGFLIGVAGAVGSVITRFAIKKLEVIWRRLKK